jgi:CSLREA domain-containing protein
MKHGAISARAARRYVAIVTLALLTTIAFATKAQAATFTVNTTADNSPVAGECAGVAGDCSLRQAINKANGSTPPTTIFVPANSYSLINGQLTITQSVTIAGDSARTTRISHNTATATARVFGIQANAKTGFVPTVTISGLDIEFGVADSTNGFLGGNIINQGNLTLSEDLITEGNTSGGSGAGISNDGGTLTVTHSLVYFNGHNTVGSTTEGGGIENLGPNPVTGTPGTLTVTDSTIYSNAAAQGGGILSRCNGASSACSSSGARNTTTVINSTIVGNDGARGPAGGGLLANDGGKISVQNSIVAGNTIDVPVASTPSNCGTGGSPTGAITSAGYNIESGTDCGFTSTGDQQSTDPQFTGAAPQNHGGNTDTFPLHAGSPAVDAIPQGAPGCGGTDQIDTPRPQGTGCDIGAYEAVQPTEGQQLTFVVGPTTCGGASATPNVVIDWGDGTTSSGTASPDRQLLIGTHTYAEEGIYKGTVTWTPGDCLRETDSFDVKVQDAPLTAAPPSFNAGAGLAFSGPVATFTDADPGGMVSDYSATIDWGDGTTSAGSVGGSGPFVVNGTHTYSVGGTYQVTVSVSDAGGAKATANGSVTVAPQTAPSLTPGAPTIKSTTSAAFTATVNPEGFATSVVFEYGPELPAARDVQHVLARATVSFSYSSTTSAQTIGPDYSNHTVTATVTGLLPNTTYHVRAVATNSAGATTGTDQTLKTPADPPPPPPVLGKSVDASVVTGLVLVKLPHNKPLYTSDAGAHAAATLTKGVGFVPLTEPRRLPVGTQVDARLGTIKLKAAAPITHGKLQTGTFNGALFSLSQDRKGLTKGLTTLSLLEGLFPGAPSYSSCKAKKASDGSPIASAALSSTVLQSLHASAHGKFRTRGRYSAATVRGTAWGELDRCDGSLTIVRRGTVEVTDFVRHVTVIVRAGHRYLARAPSTHRR